MDSTTFIRTRRIHLPRSEDGSVVFADAVVQVNLGPNGVLVEVRELGITQAEADQTGFILWRDICDMTAIAKEFYCVRVDMFEVVVGLLGAASSLRDEYVGAGIHTLERVIPNT